MSKKETNMPTPNKKKEKEHKHKWKMVGSPSEDEEDNAITILYICECGFFERRIFVTEN